MCQTKQLSATLVFLINDDDMRVDPSDVTLSSLSFPFIDTKSPNLA